jgi:dihydrodipicolinate reductase
MSPSAPLLEVSQLRKHFVVRQGLWGRARGAVRAGLWLAGKEAGRYQMREVLGL